MDEFLDKLMSLIGKLTELVGLELKAMDLAKKEVKLPFLDYVSKVHISIRVDRFVKLPELATFLLDKDSLHVREVVLTVSGLQFRMQRGEPIILSGETKLSDLVTAAAIHYALKKEGVDVLEELEKRVDEEKEKVARYVKELENILSLTAIVMHP